MNSKLWIRKALSACLSISLLATCSAVALASSGKASGELIVGGGGVLVNGESAQSGRSVFSSSTVTTPETTSAVVNFGKLGKIELAPKSSVALSFDEKGISGNLSSGKITVLGAADSINVTTSNGTTVNLKTGESILASGIPQNTDDESDGGAAWWVFGIVLVATSAIIIYSATRNNDRIALGGTGTVVSPTR